MLLDSRYEVVAAAKCPQSRCAPPTRQQAERTPRAAAIRRQPALAELPGSLFTRCSVNLRSRGGQTATDPRFSAENRLFLPVNSDEL
jgi:hypothetical protein